jgi:F420-dependent oxidoreductase-like protein
MAPGTYPADRPNRPPRPDSAGTLVASIGRVFRGRRGSTGRLHSKKTRSEIGFPLLQGMVVLELAPLRAASTWAPNAAHIAGFGAHTRTPAALAGCAISGSVLWARDAFCDLVTVRLCLMIEGQEDVTWEDWLALARACEEHGVEALFRSDHYLSVEGRGERGSLDAWATIAALAAVTSTVRLGTLVSPATFRHPSQLAKVVATADHVSGGRVELGLGTGWLDAEHEAYGFPFPPLGDRMAMLKEQLQLVTRQWAEGPFTFEGRHYAVRDLDALPKPVQRPHPNLIVGGSGGPRSLALAARFADEYNTVGKTAAECRDIRRDLDSSCRSEGRGPIPLSLMTGWLGGEDRVQLVERAGRLAEWRGYDGGGESFLRNLPASWLVGTPEELAEQLRERAGAGVERVMLQHLLHRDVDALELIGRRLAPALA